MTPQPNTQTLGIQIYKLYLHWALESTNITCVGLFGSSGIEKSLGLKFTGFFQIVPQQQCEVEPGRFSVAGS